MASTSTDVVYLGYLASYANTLLGDARAQKRATVPVWLWGKLDDTVAAYTKAAEAMCNGPRSKVGVQETRMGLLEDEAFSLLLALAVVQGKCKTDFDSTKAFLSRVILVRQDEKSLEDLVWDEREVLWKSD